MEVRLFSISSAPHQGCSGPISTHKARPESAMVLPPNFTSRRSHGGSAVCVLTHTQSQAGPTFLAMVLTWSLLPISSTCMPHRSIDRRRTCSCQQRAGMDLSIDQYTRPFPIRLMRAWMDLLWSTGRPPTRCRARERSEHPSHHARASIASYYSAFPGPAPGRRRCKDAWLYLIYTSTR
jgi:hypothetical protein